MSDPQILKLCLAQIRPFRGEVEANLEKHLHFVAQAAERHADLIFFSELSLSGYEPRLAAKLATHLEDERFDRLQRASDAHGIVVATGMPIREDHGNMIGMMIFQPNEPRLRYAKQYLHEDELPYFVAGQLPCLFSVKGIQLAPAICYESLQMNHVVQAHQAGAQVYLVSVAKAASGLDRAFAHYAQIAMQYQMPVLMSNCVGPCEDFVGGGKSAIWNPKGVLVAQMGGEEEGMLMYDLDLSGRGAE